MLRKRNLKFNTTEARSKFSNRVPYIIIISNSGSRELLCRLAGACSSRWNKVGNRNESKDTWGEDIALSWTWSRDFPVTFFLLLLLVSQWNSPRTSAVLNFFPHAKDTYFADETAVIRLRIPPAFSSIRVVVRTRATRPSRKYATNFLKGQIWGFRRKTKSRILSIETSLERRRDE